MDLTYIYKAQLFIKSSITLSMNKYRQYILDKYSVLLGIIVK